MIIDIVPDNIFGSMGNNKNMLQVIFFAVLFGIGMILAPTDKMKPVKSFFHGINDIIIKMVMIIMKYSPIGVFALLAGLIVDVAGDDPGAAVHLFKALGVYSLTVLAGLAFMIFVFYPVIIVSFTKN